MKQSKMPNDLYGQREVRPLQRTPEKYTKPSITVPNMSLTIPEILIRYSQGQPVNVSNAANLVYTGEHFIPNMKAHDLVEQAEILRIHREKTDKLKESYQAKMKARGEMKQKEQEEKILFRQFMDNIDNEERLSFYEYMNKKKIEQAKPIPPKDGVN